MGYEDCFGCGAENPKGLHLVFERTGEERVRATFQSDQWLVGWPGIQHGGVTCSMMDEAIGYVVHYLGVIAVTAEMNVQFVEPILTGETVVVEAYPTRKSKRIVEVASEVRGAHGTLKARCTAKMRVLSEKQREALGLT